MRKIVILDGYAGNPGDLSWEPMKALAPCDIYDFGTADTVVERCRDAEIVLTNKVPINAAAIAQLPELKYIGVMATGFNVVDVAEASRRGIVVTNVPAYSTESVAQMVFAHLLAVTNRTEHYANENRSGRWSASPDFCYWDSPLTELAGKTFGVVGMGNIGSRVAAIANAFAMRVVAVTSKPAEQLPPYVKKVSADELWATGDVISLHCPLSAATRNLVNRDTLQRVKPSAIIINTGRGPLVNEVDMADALRSHRLAAYCADVMGCEPPSATNPLLQCPTAHLTPHIAWASTEARQRLVSVATSNVRAWVEGRPQNVV